MMPRLGMAWVELVRSLGEALLEVFQAESEVLGRELGETGKQAGIGAAYVVAAAMIVFWFLGVATLCLVAILALWMPTWAAAGTVGLLLLVTALVLASLGWLRFKSLESPTATVKRRWTDHQDWWSTSLLASAELESRERALPRSEPEAKDEDGSEELE